MIGRRFFYFYSSSKAPIKKLHRESKNFTAKNAKSAKGEDAPPFNRGLRGWARRQLNRFLRSINAESNDPELALRKPDRHRRAIF